MAAFDNALGVSPQVLTIRAQRMNLLAANIANADTPNYKARDLDFRAALESVQAEQGAGRLETTNRQHFGFDNAGAELQTKYRVPNQLSLDGNTVDPHREHAEFMDNAMKYQASLNLLNSRIKGLMNAIKGGQ